MINSFIRQSSAISCSLCDLFFFRDTISGIYCIHSLWFCLAELTVLASSSYIVSWEAVRPPIFILILGNWTRIYSSWGSNYQFTRKVSICIIMNGAVFIYSGAGGANHIRDSKAFNFLNRCTLFILNEGSRKLWDMKSINESILCTSITYKFSYRFYKKRRNSIFESFLSYQGYV